MTKVYAHRTALAHRCIKELLYIDALAGSAHASIIYNTWYNSNNGRAETVPYSVVLRGWTVLYAAHATSTLNRNSCLVALSPSPYNVLITIKTIRREFPPRVLPSSLLRARLHTAASSESTGLCKISCFTFPSENMEQELI